MIFHGTDIMELTLVQRTQYWVLIMYYVGQGEFLHWVDLILIGFFCKPRQGPKNALNCLYIGNFICSSNFFYVCLIFQSGVNVRCYRTLKLHQIGKKFGQICLKSIINDINYVYYISLGNELIYYIGWSNDNNIWFWEQ